MVKVKCYAPQRAALHDRDAPQPPAFLPTPSHLCNKQAKTLDDIEGCCDMADAMQALAAEFAEEFAALEEELARSTDDDNLAGDDCTTALPFQALFVTPQQNIWQTILTPDIWQATLLSFATQ